MDQFRKKHLFYRVPGGVQWSMVLRGPFSMFHSENWSPAADVYETDSAIIVYMDISGVEPHTLAVMAEDSQVTVSGVRGYEPLESVSCVHRLEIECGFFERTIPLPKTVDASKAVSECRNGFLLISLPLRRNTGKIKITVG
jgi:HSP20 family protein